MPNTDYIYSALELKHKAEINDLNEKLAAVRKMLEAARAENDKLMKKYESEIRQKDELIEAYAKLLSVYQNLENINDDKTSSSRVDVLEVRTVLL